MPPLTPSHSLKESRHTQRASSAVRTVLSHIIWSKGRVYNRLLWLDFGVSWLDWTPGPVAEELQSCILIPRLSAPLLQRWAGGRDCWPAMFLALVVTPELREFLARARGGAVRLMKVRIQDGEWPWTVYRGAEREELALSGIGCKIWIIHDDSFVYERVLKYSMFIYSMWWMDCFKSEENHLKTICWECSELVTIDDDTQWIIRWKNEFLMRGCILPGWLFPVLLGHDPVNWNNACKQCDRQSHVMVFALTWVQTMRGFSLKARQGGSIQCSQGK